MAEDGAQGDSEPDPGQDLLGYLQRLQTRVQPLTRSAAQLPGPSDLSFHRSLDRSVARDLDVTKEEVLQCINDVLACVTLSSTTDVKGKGKLDARTADAGAGQGPLVAMDDLIDGTSFEKKLGDVIDTLLERTDTRLDEFLGKMTVRPVRSAVTARSTADLGPLPPHILNAPIRPSPQQHFSKQPDNSRERQWHHQISDKPHAKVPLSWKPPSLLDKDSPVKTGIRQGMYCAEGDPRENPYYFEIQKFEPPAHALDDLDLGQLQPPPPLRKDEPDGGPVPFHWVDDKASFEALYDHLNEERVLEVAIDVEHHNFRSYQGLVCLVQVSTRWHDYIIDALSPTIRDICHKLNDIFADPNKVKVLHGADHDVLWLQRDLGLYLVGLFDTYHATNVLNFSQHGLAYLLFRYIDFTADKRYQLADWRIRPLPKEMLFYARSDTHSLLHVYDCLRFEIAQQHGPTGIRTVFEDSKRVASKTYAKEQWNDSTESREGWRSTWRHKGGEDAIGLDDRWTRGGGVDGLTRVERIFRALHDWRDRTARSLDESPRYVLSVNNILKLASLAPTTREAVLNCVGQGLKKRADELTQVITKEISAFEKGQKRNAARQRELLERVAAGQEDEEMGEIMERKGGVSSAPIWPGPAGGDGDVPNTAPQAVKKAGVSSLAALLFPTASIPNASKRTSIFAPISKAVAKQNLLQSIRQDLTSTLRSVLGGRARDVQGERYSLALHNQAAEVDGMDLSGAGPPSGAVESVEVFEAAANDKAVDVVAPPAEEMAVDDGILNVRKANGKKRKEKKERASGSAVSSDAGEGAASSPAESKKRKWTKEEKAERKRRQKEAEEAAANVKPFDYSAAVSVLDASTPTATPSTKGRGKKDKGHRGDDKAKASPASSDAKSGKKDSNASPRQGRYANVPVGRDRREQAGGKSQTFSN